MMVRSAILLAIFWVMPFLVFGQVTLSTKNKKAIELYTSADNYRVRGQHEQALSLLDQAIARDKKFAEAYYRRGLVYMTIKNFQKAISDFNTAVGLTDDPRKLKVFYYDLGESQLLTGDYDNAATTLENFLRLENQNRNKIEQAKVLLNNARFGKAHANESSRYSQRALSDTVNRFVMQYFPVLTADQQQLIFTRRAGYGPNDDEDLVVSRKSKSGQWLAPVSLSDKINSQLNEGTCTVSADGRRLIYTSCAGGRGYGSCDLYLTEKVGNEWTVPANLGPNVNTSEWESQPALSADGRTLYFVSDRRGGYGRRDIWVSHLDADEQWTKAENMGRAVNTQFDEISPFIHVNNRAFFFASNGLPGFGGYDIYYVERDSTREWSKPKNVGPPINNHEDQFSLFITTDGKTAYYSHEEPGNGDGHTISRIFQIQIPPDQIKQKSNYVTGVVRDKEDKSPLSAKVELYNIETNEIESLVESDSITGEYLIILTQGSEYALYVNKKGYLFQSLNFDYMEGLNNEPIRVDVDLEKARKGSVSVLKNIFFDVDKYELKEKSMVELKKVVRFLSENPQIHVEISGHTDNTGSAAHNRELSLQRAQSVFNFLEANGINADRLTTKGYGPDKPIASNDTDSGKQENRRIEFRILN